MQSFVTHPDPLAPWRRLPRAAANLRVPPRICPSEWAEAYRRLPKGQSARPGPYRNANAPYLAAIMNLADAPGVAEVIVAKAAQVGVSEAARNLLGYWAMQDPEPCGLLLPNEDKGRKIIGNRIIPMIRQTPVLRDLMTESAYDLQKGEITLANGFRLHLMWSGSAASMAADPMCRAIADEVDKFAPYTGIESDPISLVRKRLTTYGRRARLMAISTPTLRTAPIWQMFETADVQLRFYCVCPHCDRRQHLIFGQLKWPTDQQMGIAADAPDRRLARARYIRHHGAAWYECEHCHERITEREHKAAFIRSGVWKSEDGSIEDADQVRTWPTGTRLGMHVNALYALWVSWSEIAAAFVEAKAAGGLAALQDFFNSVLGEPFEQQIGRTTANQFSDRSKAPGNLPEGIVPHWARKLICTVDTQADHFYVVIRAWGTNQRSARVWHGTVREFADLDRLCKLTLWPRQRQGEIKAKSDEAHQVKGVPIDPHAETLVDICLIDTGGTVAKVDGDPTRTREVYTWASARPSWVFPIKGDARPMRGVLVRRGANETGTAVRGRDVNLRLVSTHACNDELQALIQRDGNWWALNDHNDAVYNEHMGAVHKVAAPGRSAGRVGMTEEWKPLTAGLRHDYRDCEAYQIAALSLLGPNWQRDEADRATVQRINAPQGGGWFAAQKRRKRGEGWGGSQKRSTQ